MKELGEHSASIWELQSDIAAQLIQNTSFYQAYLQDLFLRLPKNGTLKEGMEWSISGDTTRFRVAADDKNYTIISSNGGNYHLDRKSLLLLDRKSTRLNSIHYCAS